MCANNFIYFNITRHWTLSNWMFFDGKRNTKKKKTIPFRFFWWIWVYWKCCFVLSFSFCNLNITTIFCLSPKLKEANWNFHVCSKKSDYKKGIYFVEREKNFHTEFGWTCVFFLSFSFIHAQTHIRHFLPRNEKRVQIFLHSSKFFTNCIMLRMRALPVSTEIHVQKFRWVCACAQCLYMAYVRM